MNNNDLIKNIIISQKNFHLLPRNEDNYCVYEGDLLLSGHVINKLPENFRVDGNFYCSNVGLEKLPKGLVITGEFNCYSNNLTKLPNDLVVLKDLYCFKNKLQDIPVSIVVNGTIFCYDNDMSIFRIINGNTKAIYNNGEIKRLNNHEDDNKLVLNIDDNINKILKETIDKTKETDSNVKSNNADYQQKYLDRIDKEKMKKEEELDEIKMSKLSDEDKSIYKRVIDIRNKRKNMTSNRYMYY